MSKASKINFKKIKKIDYVDHKNIDEISNKYDWVMGCPVETSVGLKTPIVNFKIKKEM